MGVRQGHPGKVQPLEPLLQGLVDVRVPEVGQAYVQPLVAGGVELLHGQGRGPDLALALDDLAVDGAADDPGDLDPPGHFAGIVQHLVHRPGLLPAVRVAAQLHLIPLHPRHPDVVAGGHSPAGVGKDRPGRIPLHLGGLAPVDLLHVPQHPGHQLLVRGLTVRFFQGLHQVVGQHPGPEPVEPLVEHRAGRGFVRGAAGDHGEGSPPSQGAGAGRGAGLHQVHAVRFPAGETQGPRATFKLGVPQVDRAHLQGPGRLLEVQIAGAGARVAGVQDDRDVRGLDLIEKKLKLIVAQLLARGARPHIGRAQHLVAAVVLVAAPVRHLGAVPAVVEHHRVPGFGLPDQPDLHRPDDVRLGGVRVHQLSDVIGLVPELGQQQLFHHLHIIGRPFQVHAGAVEVVPDPHQKSPFFSCRRRSESG